MIRFAGMELIEKVILGNTIVAVGHHQGEQVFKPEDHAAPELQLLQQLSPRKQSEWLASRALLYQIAELPDRAQCIYDDFGKPFLKGIDKHISVSHSERWCAAMISDHPCGVDIQVYSETVERIADRFLTPDDLIQVQQLSHPLHRLHLLWGAKECLYKAYGKRKLGFRENIMITYLNEKSGEGKGEIVYEDIHLFYDIYFKLLPDVAWVYCVERNDPAFSSDIQL